MNAYGAVEGVGAALLVGAVATAIFWKVRGRTAGLVSGAILALATLGTGFIIQRTVPAPAASADVTPSRHWATREKLDFVTGCERTAPGTMSESCACFADELEKVADFKEVSKVSDSSPDAATLSPALRTQFTAIVEACRARASK